MRLTGEAGGLPEVEQQDIIRIAAEIGVPAAFLAAIRIAENGGDGRQFGVLSESADTYEAQARIAALSIRNNQWRHVLRFKEWPVDGTGLLSEGFVKFMQSRWAPIGADNDPNGLNANWSRNVLRAYRNSGII